MGGEGSMMHAIKSLKANRNMLKKRKLKSKSDVYGTKSVTELHFKKASRRDIVRIRKKMFIQREKEKRAMFYAVLATVVLFFILFMLLIR
ncbi:MAG: hypothetical protein ACE37L_06790 [Allomuricauda sp.]|jgi:hypothetical protein|nr:hypothetical protein [Muricauda sp. ARW1Y1]